tara:strand:+ start:57 stop:545 length:489 start_codon:yes stop_codon:yes gene_type:complete
MIKAIIASDDKGGISKNGSMPWPKNSSDLQWFKKNTLNNVVVMGRLTWEDPFMPAPLNKRINVLVTNNDSKSYPGADHYISGDLNSNIKKLTGLYIDKDIYIIGGAEIVNQTFTLVEEFYLTRIYGDFECDKKIDLNKIKKEMNLNKKIKVNKICHIEIWKK